MCWVGTGEDSPGLDGVAEDREMWLGGRWDRNGEAMGAPTVILMARLRV
jgi:hypothetical protein